VGLFIFQLTMRLGIQVPWTSFSDTELACARQTDDYLDSILIILSKAHANLPAARQSVRSFIL
jgi:hypothetical protein